MFNVAIIGGGIGGLTLAHGLRRAGVAVRVYERDRSKEERLQGYRIHISPKGCRALHECLPEHLYQLFTDTSGKPNTTLGFYDERFRELLVIGDTAAEEHRIDSYRSVNRMALRKVLLRELDDVVEFGKRFVRYENLPDGRVRARFEDGTHADADLLVAADGAGSRVREQLLPQAPRVDTGAFTISGKVPLDDRTRALLPRQLFAGSGMLFGPEGKTVFLAAHEFRGEREAAAGTDLLWDETADYVMWNMVTTWDKVGDRGTVQAMEPKALRDLAIGAVRGWHPRLLELMRLSDLGTVMVYPFSVATLLDGWEPGNVTLLGDAVHCMPPTAGAGANTAILDAGLLARTIAEVARGDRDLVAAVGAYEAEMRGYAFKTVRTAMRNLRQGLNDSTFSRVMAKTVFRTINRIGPIRRRMSEAMAK